MTGTKRTTADLDPRRAKALFRSWHRGTREMDLILGQFADEQIDQLNDDEMTQYEALLEVADWDLFKWIIGETDVPAEFDSATFRRIVAFQRATGL